MIKMMLENDNESESEVSVMKFEEPVDIAIVSPLRKLVPIERKPAAHIKHATLYYYGGKRNRSLSLRKK
jgi:hypothetical protein